MTLRRWLLPGLLLPLLLGARTARTDDDVEALLRAGNAAFDRGAYSDAAALYEKAGDRATEPGLVAFNLATAKYHLARDGRLVALTTFPGEQFAVSYRELVQRQLTVAGSRYNSRYEVGLAAQFVRAGRVRPVVSTIVGPGDVAATLAAVRAGTVLGRAALAW